MNRRILLCAGITLFLAAGTASALGQPDASPADLLIQARERFDGGDYEAALSLLDQSIIRFGTPTDTTRASLAMALQLRARVQFTLGNEMAARDDFARLVTLDPDHTLPPEVSPRISAVFNEVRASRVGTILLVVDPVDAAVQVDGRPAAVNALIALPVGEHTLTATRPGYSPYSAPLVIMGGSSDRLDVTMTRVSAALTLLTSPPGLEVFINGNLRGTTEAGPLPPEYADLPGRLAIRASDIARPMVVADLPPGNYIVQFRKACYQTETRSLTIEAPRDYSLSMVLRPAVATLTVEAPDTGALVYVDDEPRGNPPVTIRDLCEGEHAVEVRSPEGRYAERVTARPGGTLSVKGTLKPAFAILPVTGLPEGYRGEDLRIDIQRALRSARHLTFVVPPFPALKPLLAKERMEPDALSFDMARRPVGSAALMTPAARRDMVRRLSQDLDVQGLAAVIVPQGDTLGRRVTLTLFARGGSEPDVLLLDLDQASSISTVLERLDVSPEVSTTVLGMLGIEVTGIEGVVVARVDDDGPARAAGLVPGERITHLLTERITDGATLTRILEERRNAESLPSTVVGRDGTPRQVMLRPVLAPRLVSVLDRTLAFNALAAQWRYRVQKATGPDAGLVHLNLAVAALRMGDFEGAREELGQVQLRPGAGISEGTTQYLLGLAHKGLGEFSRAREAWTRAAAAEQATLSEHGGRVAELARQELQALRGGQ